MSDISLKTLKLFEKYFSGSRSAYGVHIHEPTEFGVKEEGKSWTETKLLNPKLYLKHLEGSVGLGIIPIVGDKCGFSVIDVDIYGKDLSRFIDIVYNNNLPIVPFRTKSGGLHLYIFYREPIQASKARKIMTHFVNLFGLGLKTEVFPKQGSLNVDDKGSWLNLPYFNCKETKQFMYGPNCKKLGIDEAMHEIGFKLSTEESIANILSTIPLNDAPPCLQAIYLRGSTDYRNNYLFSLGCYYKSKYGDDFEFKLMEANNKLNEPLSVEEVTKTIISTHKRKNYTYKCSEEPIHSICKAQVCKTRKYGIGGDEINQVSYEEFYQYDTDPPYYEWVVNKHSLKFYNEMDIIHQQKFRMLCFRKLHILPYRLKDVTWTKIVNKALDHVIVQHVDREDDISTGSIFHNNLIEFLENRTVAKSKEQINIDRVYKDEEISAYIFKPKNFLTFLIFQKQFREYGATQIQDKLRELGGEPKRYYISKEKGTVRVWILPFDKMLNYKEEIDKDNQDFDIDFKENYDEEPF